MRKVAELIPLKKWVETTDDTFLGTPQYMSPEILIGQPWTIELGMHYGKLYQHMSEKLGHEYEWVDTLYTGPVYRKNTLMEWLRDLFRRLKRRMGF